ncbi:dihydroxyacetone kinase subunit DhaK [Paenibacillus sp. MSJ-34]|uniref:dihydroxyacetone kinase subunit DhaK n=1 Tax=Paenibacillus sp. MSJ-34 TaxID=2841529 RepID=UPI001C118EDA|nr:dihydroxyacetone kinase subunit DhaK [Paenibacillus sp. MSJ-34]MBU5444188.1 dihydroxyacetone kinase subunit DhaK [Paenibacillus sp. MSJ-34]
MKKLVNLPDAVVDEMVEGYAAAFPQYVTISPDNHRALVRAVAPPPGKVGIVVGGGSGHEPAFMGVIGKGMADGVPVGNIFASPPPLPIVTVTKAVDAGAGVLYMYGNYAGDCMNFDMAAELADMEGIRVETVRVTDDVCSAPAAERDRRRGIAGGFLAFKAAGAAADLGYSLDEVVRIASKANDHIRTMGVALSPCYNPQTGRPSFMLGDDEMEIGLGIHGEPGVERGTVQPADETADALFDTIVADMPLAGRDRVAVLVNGLGSTTRMELLIMFRRIERRLRQIGVTIHRSYVGEFVTSLEMGGCSVTLMKLDDELAQMIDHPADTPMFVQV